MKTTNKFKGKKLKKICRKSQRAFKKFVRENPNLIVRSVSRQIYKSYGTLCISYKDTINGGEYGGLHIFF